MEDQIPFAGEMLGATLFLVGLIVSWVLWRRRGAASGLRGLAWSLLFLAAGLTGLIEALWGFGSQLLGSILSPVLWAGVATGGLAVVLYVVSGVMKARGVGTAGRRRKTPPEEGADQAEGGADAPQVSQGGSAGGGQSQGGDDFSDVEELLRRRGIT